MTRSFAEILAALPADVPRTHHGRSPSEGFDCTGLPFYIYREAGWPIDDADIPYTEAEADQINRDGIMEKQLSGRLSDCTQQVRMGNDQDGDIWLFSIQDGLRHAGVYADGFVYHMAEKLYRRDAARIRPFLRRAYRIPKESTLF